MKYTIEFTEEELNAVAAAIAEMPYRMAKPLMDNIQNQVNQLGMPPQHEEMPEGAQVQ